MISWLWQILGCTAKPVECAACRALGRKYLTGALLKAAASCRSPDQKLLGIACTRFAAGERSVRLIALVRPHPCVGGVHGSCQNQQAPTAYPIGQRICRAHRAGSMSGCIAARRNPGTSADAARMRRWSEIHSLPNADTAVKPVYGTRAEVTPLEAHFRMDLGVIPPSAGNTTGGFP